MPAHNADEWFAIAGAVVGNYDDWRDIGRDARKPIAALAATAAASGVTLEGITEAQAAYIAHGREEYMHVGCTYAQADEWAWRMVAVLQVWNTVHNKQGDHE